MVFSQEAFDAYQASRHELQPEWKGWPTVDTLLERAGVELSPLEARTTFGQLSLDDRIVLEHHDADGQPIRPPVIADVVKLPSDEIPCAHISGLGSSATIVVPVSLAAEQYNFYDLSSAVTPI